jgi:hypothetical protein
MVLKSVCLGLKNAEVPVRFLKDKQGRLRHMKRSGWTEPWRAGWINLRAMLLFGADFFLLRPGVAVLTLGLLLMLPESFGPLPIGSITLSLYWSLLGLTLSVVGLQSFYLGCVIQVIYSYNPASSERWLRLFRFDRAMLISALMAITGISMSAPIVVQYIRSGLRLPLVGALHHLAVTGLFFLIAAFLTFSNTLVLNGSATRLRPRNRSAG